MMQNQEGSYSIEPWLSVEDRDRAEAELDAIFFASSATQSFADDATRAAFRHRWLGRYLAHYPEWAFVALDRDGHVAGYVVGSIVDPARTPLFDDISYFQALAPLTARFPAQLHVNVSERARSMGLGARLVARFAEEAAQKGVPGVHVVTAHGMRNIAFYERIGFLERGPVSWNGRELVMLGLDLRARPASA